MKLKLLAVALIILPTCNHLTIAEGLQTEFFPNQILFPKFLADGTAQQMSINMDLHSRRWPGSIGGMERIPMDYPPILCADKVTAACVSTITRYPKSERTGTFNGC